MLAATAALLLAGCGSTNSSSSSGSTSSPSASPTKAGLIAKADACTLVTADDASAAVGTTVTNMSGGAATAGICAYGTADGQATVIALAQVYPDSTTAGNVSPQQLSAALNGAYGIGTAKVVTGIGDKAVEYSLNAASGTSGIVIFVFKANVVLMIAITPTSDSTKIEQLARTAIGKLS